MNIALRRRAVSRRSAGGTALESFSAVLIVMQRSFPFTRVALTGLGTFQQWPDIQQAGQVILEWLTPFMGVACLRTIGPRLSG